VELRRPSHCTVRPTLTYTIHYSTWYPFVHKCIEHNSGFVQQAKKFTRVPGTGGTRYHRLLGVVPGTYDIGPRFNFEVFGRYSCGSNPSSFYHMDVICVSVGVVSVQEQIEEQLQELSTTYSPGSHSFLLVCILHSAMGTVLAS